MVVNIHIKKRRLRISVIFNKKEIHVMSNTAKYFIYGKRITVEKKRNNSLDKRPREMYRIIKLTATGIFFLSYILEFYP
jgi:hypothetical protein